MGIAHILTRNIIDLLYKDDNYMFIKGEESLIMICTYGKPKIFALISYGNDIYIRDEDGNSTVFNGLHLPFVIKDMEEGRSIGYWKGEITPNEFGKLMMDEYNRNSWDPKDKISLEDRARIKQNILRESGKKTAIKGDQ